MDDVRALESSVVPELDSENQISISVRIGECVSYKNRSEYRE